MKARPAHGGGALWGTDCGSAIVILRDARMKEKKPLIFMVVVNLKFACLL